MKQINSMSLAEKVGQMFVCGFEGYVPNDDIKALISNYHLGGIIYFRRNVREVGQIAKLSYDLQKWNEEKSDIPLLISIDQEGGMVARIDSDEVTLVPGNMAIGATRNTDLAYEAARICGLELRDLGINVNFAPSVDVNNNALNPVIGVRSYGERADLVAEMGAAAIRGLQEAGIAATAKHFPGHGDTESDTHYGLAEVPHERERLFNLELVPFKRAIAEGVDAIMTAHVMFPAIEPASKPATLSRHVLTDLLRGELKYSGVIITDCMEMHAISKHFGVAEGAVMAVEAGADLVLVSHTFESQVASIEAVIAAVESGRVPEAQIDESVKRIMELKRTRQMDRFSRVTPDLASRFGTTARKDIVRQICEQSVTLVKDDGQLPLDKNEPTIVIWPEVKERTEVDEPVVQRYTLAAALSESMANVQEIRIGTNPEPEEVRTAIEACAGYKQIVVATYNAVSTLHEGQVEIVRELAARSGVKLVVASTRNPYDLNQFPDIATYLCCYENRPMTMAALGQVLTGAIPALGKLPVTIAAEYPFGHSATLQS